MVDWLGSFFNPSDSDEDIIFDDFSNEYQIQNEEISSALITTGNTFNNGATSLIFRESIEYGYEIDSIKFEGFEEISTSRNVSDVQYAQNCKT